MGDLCQIACSICSGGNFAETDKPRQITSKRQKAVSALNNAYSRTIRRILTAGDRRGCFRWPRRALVAP